MSKIVYITGCLGFIGSYVTRTCLKLGWYVKGIDKITYAARPELLDEFRLNPKFSFIQKDICDLDSLYECDYIINIAAESHVDNSIRSSDEFISSNINGVHNLLELCKHYNKNTSKCPILFHFSTDETYGDAEIGMHKETDLLIPSNPYSATKAAADMLILAWARTYKIPYIILRPTNNYGIGQYVEKLIPRTIKLLSLDRKTQLHNNGEPIRNWLHAQDTANAVITIINSGRINEIYNVAGGYEQKNIDTCRKIVDLFYNKTHSFEELKEYIDLQYSRPGIDVRYALDDSKLRSLGWKPEKEFDLELPSIVDYYRSNFIW